jgi:hypothetical protein
MTDSNSFTPSSAVGYRTSPLPGLWNCRIQGKEFLSEFPAQDASSALPYDCLVPWCLGGGRPAGVEPVATKRVPSTALPYDCLVPWCLGGERPAGVEPVATERVPSSALPYDCLVPWCLGGERLGRAPELRLSIFLLTNCRGHGSLSWCNIQPAGKPVMAPRRCRAASHHGGTDNQRWPYLA